MKPLAPLIHLSHRPGLIAAAVVGTGAGWFVRNYMEPTSALLVGWCSGVAVYLAVALWNANRDTAVRIRERAALLDEGGGVVLVFAVTAAVASIVAIVADLAKSKGSPNAGAAAVLALITVVLSWTFIHAVFGFHYAHEYYKPNSDNREKCLNFPGNTPPQYWDFAYFSFIVGMTAQVADVATVTRKMRMIVLAHSIIAFFFNTAILALGVNLAANFID